MVFRATAAVGAASATEANNVKTAMSNIFSCMIGRELSERIVVRVRLTG